MDELVSELTEECPAWSDKPSIENVDLVNYDHILFDDIADNIEAFENFEASLYYIKSLLQLEISAASAIKLEPLLFVNVITALEVYLSDGFISMVSANQELR